MPDVKFTDVYSVNIDDLDGRVFGALAYFSTKESATEYAKGRGDWGDNAPVSACPSISIDGIVYVLKQYEPIDLDLQQANYDKELRERTLASLTSEQRRVLGI